MVWILHKYLKNYKIFSNFFKEFLVNFGSILRTHGETPYATKKY